MITHGMVFYNIVNLAMPAGVNSKSVNLIVLPLFHTGGLNCYANPILHAGGQILLMREFEPGAALSVLGDADLGVTHFFAVPAPYQFMMQHPDFDTTDLSRLQTAGVGGAPCAEAILQGWMDRGAERPLGGNRQGRACLKTGRGAGSRCRYRALHTKSGEIQSTGQR